MQKATQIITKHDPELVEGEFTFKKKNGKSFKVYVIGERPRKKGRTAKEGLGAKVWVDVDS
jgi:translation initiation factor 2B subunit (eIF-2B alpha/beta/delta family)